MTITAEDLKAFAPFASVEKQQAVSVDMSKVASTLVSEAALMVTGEGDPAERVATLTSRVDLISSMLEKAIEDKDGKVTVTGDEAIAKIAAEFAAETVKVVDPTATPAKPDDVAPAPDPVKPDDVAKSGEEIEWPRDLSPKTPPTLRSERMTKGQRPVPARKGAGASVEQKYNDKRERAMGRTSGDRVMT